MTVVAEIVALACLFLLLLQLGVLLGWRWGKRYGQRVEVRYMIDLLGALKIDSYEQSVFRDRFVRALEWTLRNDRAKDPSAK